MRYSVTVNGCVAPLRSTVLAVCLGLALCSLGCDSGSEDNGSSGGAALEGTVANTAELASQCGVIDQNSFTVTVSEGAAEYVTVLPSKPDVVVVRYESGPNAGGEQLVKLHGVSSAGITGYLYDQGLAIISDYTSSGAYLVRAGCAADVDGQQGIYGQLFSVAGENINELLIANGSVVPAADACGGDQISGCYGTITVVEQVSSERVTDFLWKPVSDSDGKVAVLVNPYDASVRIVGRITETPRPIGPGNGRGSQFRGSRPGCAYGSNVRVEVYDSQGLIIPTGSGERYVTVPNGCQRTRLRW